MDLSSPAVWIALGGSLLVAALLAAFAREWWHRPVTEQLEHLAEIVRYYGERGEPKS